MVNLSRKQREIKLREAEILKLARPILLREGYQALSMERLATLMEYAKGTLYNHFPNKEEIVLALAIESMELRYQLFQAASEASTQSRNRLMAIGAACELYTQDYGDHFAIEDWIRNTTIWDKSSPKRQELILQCESRCMSVVAGIVRDAVEAGDLALRPGLSAEEMIFGFWALNYGSQVLAATSPSLSSLGIPDAPKAIRHHCFTLMNGFAWKPMLEFDAHDALMDRLVSQLKKQFDHV
jgi:AcrR family transcriptional regulator